MSARTMKRALLQYEAIGWTGYVPESMRNTQLHLPLNYCKLLWGWPDKFLARMERADTRVVITAGTGGFSEGFDFEQSLAAIPEGFTGYIWTNSIEIIAPLIR